MYFLVAIDGSSMTDIPECYFDLRLSCRDIPCSNYPALKADQIELLRAPDVDLGSIRPVILMCMMLRFMAPTIFLAHNHVVVTVNALAWVDYIPSWYRVFVCLIS